MDASPALVAGSILVAVAAALRSTWSPCALSMLSAMTPLAERARGHRFVPTALWFVAGAVVGGATLGAAAALLAAGVGALDLSLTVRVSLLAVAAAVGAAADLGVLRLPMHGRQVDERWFDSYRRWVYASGFGWQIGVGLSTFITTAAVYVTVVAAVLLASPGAAMALCLLFATVRGLTVFLGLRLHDMAAVQAVHARLDAWSTASIRLTAAVQGVVVVGLAAALGLVPLVLAAVAVAAVAAVALAGARPRARVEAGSAA